MSEAELTVGWERLQHRVTIYGTDIITSQDATISALRHVIEEHTEMLEGLDTATAAATAQFHSGCITALEHQIAEIMKTKGLVDNMVYRSNDGLRRISRALEKTRDIAGDITEKLATTTNKSSVNSMWKVVREAKERLGEIAELIADTARRTRNTTKDLEQVVAGDYEADYDCDSSVDL